MRVVPLNLKWPHVVVQTPRNTCHHVGTSYRRYMHNCMKSLENWSKLWVPQNQRATQTQHNHQLLIISMHVNNLHTKTVKFNLRLNTCVWWVYKMINQIPQSHTKSMNRFQGIHHTTSHSTQALASHAPYKNTRHLWARAVRSVGGGKPEFLG